MNEYIAHEEDYRGYRIEVLPEYDTSIFDPRENDNAGTFYCKHPRYNLGDEQIGDPETFLDDLSGLDFDDEFGDRLDAVWRWLCDRYDSVYGVPTDGSESPFDFESIENAARAKFEKLVEAKLEGFIILPLYLYDHSGITISCSGFSCPWDSGQVGCAVLTKAEIDHEWNGDREKAEAYLRATVEEYARYLEGNVYYVRVSEIVIDEDGDEELVEIEDSGCGGFIGYPDDERIIDEAKSLIDYELRHVAPDGNQHDSELDLAGFTNNV